MMTTTTAANPEAVRPLIGRTENVRSTVQQKTEQTILWSGLVQMKSEKIVCRVDAYPILSLPSKSNTGDPEEGKGKIEREIYSMTHLLEFCECPLLLEEVELEALW